MERFSPAPGQHGYARAFDLISRHVSMGQFGSPGLECAVKTVPPCLAFLLSQTSAGKRQRRIRPCICFRPVPSLVLPSSRPCLGGAEHGRPGSGRLKNAGPRMARVHYATGSGGGRRTFGVTSLAAPKALSELLTGGSLSRGRVPVRCSTRSLRVQECRYGRDRRPCVRVGSSAPRQPRSHRRSRSQPGWPCRWPSP